VIHFFNTKFYVFLIILIVSTYWSINESLVYYTAHSNKQSQISNQAISETKVLVNDINDALSPLLKSAKNIASELKKNDFSKPEIENLLTDTLIKHVNIFGVGITFEPYQYIDDKRLYAPYFMRKNTKLESIDIADYYDYTEPEYQWYTEALRSDAQSNKLYYDQISEEWLIRYTLPVIKNNQPIALIIIDYTLDSLQRRINLTDLGEQGYSFIVDNTGRFIDYPIIEKVHSNSLIDDLPDFKLAKMQQTLINIKNGRSGKITYNSDITHKPSWLYYESIPDTHWSVITVYEKPNLVEGDTKTLGKFINLTIYWSIVLLSITGVIASSVKQFAIMKYWGTVFVISFIFSINIAVLWYVTLQVEIDTEKNITTIASYADLETFKKSYTTESLLNRNDPPLYVPTGVFVQSIEFTSANNVIMTGYIWQRYHNEYHKTLSRGVVFPEAESIELVKSYERKEENNDLLGWYFKVTLRQNFNYSHYPLDNQSVWIRLWHKDFDKNTVLLPFLESYDRLNPDWLPGIEKDFVLSGWKLNRSYFNYHHNSYNTNFGIENYIGQSKFPELYFNIVLKRDFFDAFISQLAPLVVVLLMLFAIFVTSSKDENRNALLGFNTSGVLASSSALFFVVMVSHIDLRSSLAAKEIIYLEAFYFVTYLTILIISINSILFSWGVHFPVINNKSLIQHRDNLIPKLLYWPMVTGQLLMLTLIALYPQN